MTREELVKMVGSEQQAEYTLKLLLKSVKQPMITSVIKNELSEIEKQIADYMDDGVICKINGFYEINKTSDETKRMDAEVLLYRRNRTVCLLAAI